MDLILVINTFVNRKKGFVSSCVFINFDVIVLDSYRMFDRSFCAIKQVFAK